MENLYNIIESLCAQNGISVTRMSAECGVSRSTLSELKTGRSKMPSIKTLSKIACYFTVDPAYLQKFASKESVDDISAGITHCQFCNFDYSIESPTDLLAHRIRHQKKEEAIKKYGFCWNYDYREAVKAYVYDCANDVKPLTLEDEHRLGIAYLKAYFSRSLEGNCFDLDHPTFEMYCGCLLYNGSKDNTEAERFLDRVKENVAPEPITFKGTYWVSTNTNASAFQKDEPRTRVAQMQPETWTVPNWVGEIKKDPRKEGIVQRMAGMKVEDLLKLEKIMDMILGEK